MVSPGERARKGLEIATKALGGRKAAEGALFVCDQSAAAGRGAGMTVKVLGEGNVSVPARVLDSVEDHLKLAISFMADQQLAAAGASAGRALGELRLYIERADEILAKKGPEA